MLPMAPICACLHLGHKCGPRPQPCRPAHFTTAKPYSEDWTAACAVCWSSDKCCGRYALCTRTPRFEFLLLSTPPPRAVGREQPGIDYVCVAFLNSLSSNYSDLQPIPQIPYTLSDRKDGETGSEIQNSFFCVACSLYCNHGSPTHHLGVLVKRQTQLQNLTVPC